jgi:hypothetical protein
MMPTSCSVLFGLGLLELCDAYVVKLSTKPLFTPNSAHVGGQAFEAGQCIRRPAFFSFLMQRRSPSKRANLTQHTLLSLISRLKSLEMLSKTVHQLEKSGTFT